MAPSRVSAQSSHPSKPQRHGRSLWATRRRDRSRRAIQAVKTRNTGRWPYRPPPMAVSLPSTTIPDPGRNVSRARGWASRAGRWARLETRPWTANRCVRTGMHIRNSGPRPRRCGTAARRAAPGPVPLLDGVPVASRLGGKGPTFPHKLEQCRNCGPVSAPMPPGHVRAGSGGGMQADGPGPTDGRMQAGMRDAPGGTALTAAHHRHPGPDAEPDAVPQPMRPDG